MTERLFGRGRRGGVLLIAGAVLGAAIAGPGATIAQKAMNLTTSTADKRYVKRAEMRAAGVTVDTTQRVTATTFTPIAETTLKAPGPGFLVLNGSLSAKDDGNATPDTLEYRLAVNGAPIPVAPNAFLLYLNSNQARENGSIDGFVQVPRKGPVDIQLQAQNLPGSTGANVLGRSLTVQFVPKAKVGKKGKKKGGGGGGGNVGP